MLVSAAANDKVENLPLARRQCRDMGANHVELALQATRHFMMRNRSRNCPKKIVRRYGLGQKIIRTRLDGPYRGRNIEVTTEEYDRQRRTEFAQPRLEFRTAYPRHPHVKDNTAWDTFARQAIQQVLGRNVGGDLVTGYRQTNVSSLSGRTHRHRQYARTLAQVSPQRSVLRYQGSATLEKSKISSLMSGCLTQIYREGDPI